MYDTAKERHEYIMKGTREYLGIEGKEFPHINSYNRCSKCGSLFAPKGPKFIDFMCKCKFMTFPMTVFKLPYKEEEIFKSKLNIQDIPLSNNSLSLLKQANIIFENEGNAKFMQAFPNRTRAIKDSQVYSWILKNTKYVNGTR